MSADTPSAGSPESDYERGRTDGIRQLAKAVNKALTPESVESLVQALSASLAASPVAEEQTARYDLDGPAGGARGSESLQMPQSTGTLQVAEEPATLARLREALRGLMLDYEAYFGDGLTESNEPAVLREARKALADSERGAS